MPVLSFILISTYFFSQVQVFTDPIDVMKIKRSAKLARKMLDYANSLVQAGITTEDIDLLTHQEIIAHGAYPSPVNYCGFPKAICTSVNEVVCHGIPDDRKLVEGDMISIDVSLFLDGFHGDNCGTVIVGKSQDSGALKLIDATQECLDQAVAACGPGRCFADIGAAIERVAASRDVRIVREFCGHGLGPTLHMQPLVEHCHNRSKIIMEPGMVFTIEPIIVEGNRRISVWSDGWTAATFDGLRAAQFEHEVLITENGAEVITIPE